MLQTLSPQQLTVTINPVDLGFTDTSQLLTVGRQPDKSWIGQPAAEAAATFGLNLYQPSFHLLVLGEPGCGRTSLLLDAMQQAAVSRPPAPDLIYLYNFETPEKPISLSLKTGTGHKLRIRLDHFVRQLLKVIPAQINENSAPKNAELTELQVERAPSEEARQTAMRFVDEQLASLGAELADVFDSATIFAEYLAALRRDLVENIEIFHSSNDSEGSLEAFLSRYRANLLVDNRGLQHAPVIYDDDPSFQSLFGGMEGSSDSSNALADFMRLRAGNLLRANGGMLMLHLRDIRSDQQSGSQILEKLHRFLRNGRVQIEESGGTVSHGSAINLSPDALAIEVKVVLIASRAEYYELQEEAAELAGYFRVKVDFVDSFAATQEARQAIAAYIAQRCVHFGLLHFSAEAIARLLCAMQRWVDDQNLISANFSELQGLMLESAALAKVRGVELVEAQDVAAAIAAQHARHQYPEQQMHQAIVEGELLIRVQGRELGQINGLTHIDLGGASFGSPVCISARCFAGDKGVLNIDREVEMTGPNHDKGLFILQSWLSASFTRLTPLSLSASLVFEQEYHGVEGDSASCAELYALLSALSGLPLPQGIAVTGALNQYGEVLPIGGVNEKIEGYFRVCQRVGLDGKQGVVIPSRNKQHLVLNDAVVKAVAEGKFHIYTISNVLAGIEHLTGMSAGNPDEEGNYRAETVMGRVQRTLESYRHVRKNNQSIQLYQARDRRS